MMVSCTGADFAPLPAGSQRGRVLACFPHAVTIAMDDGRLLSLLPEDRPRGMRTVHVHDAAWPRLRAALQPGSAALLDDRALHFAHLRLPLGTGPRWQSPQAGELLRIDTLDPGRLGRAGQWLEATLRARRPESDPSWRAAHRGFIAVLDSLDGAGAALDDSVRAAIGLGPGLTPSADDMLVGLLPGLQVMQRAQARRRLVDCIVAHDRDTTCHSRDSLAQACNGWLNSSLGAVLGALSTRADAAELLPALEAQAAVGHHSGLDILIGLLAALHHAGEGTRRPMAAPSTLPFESAWP